MAQTNWLVVLCCLAVANGSGVIVPLYVPYWDCAWVTMGELASQYPDVPLYIIGGGPTDNISYPTRDALHALQRQGVKILGYVWSNYGGNPPDSMTTQMKRYKDWYGVDGIFFDGTPFLNASYYRLLSDKAHGMGFYPAVANPGTLVPPDHIGIMDIICLHEGFSYPASFVTSYPKGQVYIIAYTVPFNVTWFEESYPYVGWYYIQDAKILPSYIWREVGLLSSLNTGAMSIASSLLKSTSCMSSSIWPQVT
jgi:hypothetical protein